MRLGLAGRSSSGLTIPGRDERARSFFNREVELSRTEVGHTAYTVGRVGAVGMNTLSMGSGIRSAGCARLPGDKADRKQPLGWRVFHNTTTEAGWNCSEKTVSSSCLVL